MTNLTDAISQAAAAAQGTEEVQTPASQAVAVQTQNAHAVAQHQPSEAMTMENVQTAGMAVSGFVKMGDDFVEVDKVKYPSIQARMILKSADKGGSFQPFQGLNYEIIKDQYKYTKTFEIGAGARVSEGDHVGKNWQQHVADIQAQTNAKPYQGYNVFFIVDVDVEPMKKGEKVLPAGTILGFSTTPTSSKTVLGVWQRGTVDGRLGDTAVVTVQGVARENAAKKKYSTMHIDFVHYLEDQVED